jgi:hypothetical protein
MYVYVRVCMCVYMGIRACTIVDKCVRVRVCKFTYSRNQALKVYVRLVLISTK